MLTHMKFPVNQSKITGIEFFLVFSVFFFCLFDFGSWLSELNSSPSDKSNKIPAISDQIKTATSNNVYRTSYTTVEYPLTYNT